MLRLSRRIPVVTRVARRLAFRENLIYRIVTITCLRAKFRHESHLDLSRRFETPI